jgi:hypothetical protein
LEAVFVLLESSSPSRRIFIDSHQLPPLFSISPNRSFGLAGGTRPAPHENGVAEAAVAVAVVVVEKVVTDLVKVVEVAMAPVKVVKEVEPSSGARRHRAHSPRAPPELEPKQPAAVEVPHDIGTPAPG